MFGRWRLSEFALRMAQAALTSPMWLKAWGKLPRSSPLTGSTSSASRPTSLTKATARSKTVRARAGCPGRLLRKAVRRADQCRTIQQLDRQQRWGRPDGRQAYGYPPDARRSGPGQQLPEYPGQRHRGRVRQWSARGAQFLTPPKQHQYEIRCYIRDPDGHIIEVGQTTDPEGDWMPARWPSEQTT